MRGQLILREDRLDLATLTQYCHAFRLGYVQALQARNHLYTAIPLAIWHRQLLIGKPFHLEDVPD